MRPAGGAISHPCAPGPDRAMPLAGGRLAQLVERFVYTEDVGGSNPSPPTINISNLLDIYEALKSSMNLELHILRCFSGFRVRTRGVVAPPNKFCGATITRVRGRVGRVMYRV